MHNYLLRYYLAEGGVHRDKDMQIRVVPPLVLTQKLPSAWRSTFRARAAIIDLPEYTRLRNQILHFLMSQGSHATVQQAS
jgi:NMT1-like family